MTAHPYANTLKAAQEAIQSATTRLQQVDGPKDVVHLDLLQFNQLIEAVEALAKMIREQYLRDYAETLLLDHTRVEFLTISEAAEEFLMGGGEITEDEMRFVHDLINRADVSIRLPPLPEGVDR